MDAKTLTVVTNALDIAIASVVETEFQRLATAAGPEQTASNVLRSLRSFERLQRGVMPTYNEWDAVFYAAWYHPGHVNLAYTIIEKIPALNNPLKSGKGSLHIRDFGCGTLAMQFGLALAAADSVVARWIVPHINIFSEDSSEPMRAIGWKIWETFVGEIANNRQYPDLATLRRVCAGITFESQRKDAGLSWLTALHVAYEENTPQVEKTLADRIGKEQPELVVVTAHPRGAPYTFQAQRYGYFDESQTIHAAVSSLSGVFGHTTLFRSDVYDKFVRPANLLSEVDDRFLQNYLTKYRTGWVTPFWETSNFLYAKKKAYDLDGLPF